MKSWNEIRKSAAAFSKRWKDAAYRQAIDCVRTLPPADSKDIVYNNFIWPECGMEEEATTDNRRPATGTTSDKRHVERLVLYADAAKKKDAQ